MRSDNKHVLVLLSGGIDSTACVDFYLLQNFNVSGLFVNYGQAAAEKELASSMNISNWYKIPLQTINCTSLKTWQDGCITGRNAFLLFTGLMNFKHNSGLLGIGIHAGTNYYDCSEEFIIKTQSIFNDYTDGRIIISAPFIKWSKGGIWEYCQSKSVPLELTYSCELGLSQPCGPGLSCKDLEVLYAS